MDALNYMKAMLNRYRPGDTVNDADALFLIAALRRHPEAESKIGVAIGILKSVPPITARSASGSSARMAPRNGFHTRVAFEHHQARVIPSAQSLRENLQRSVHGETPSRSSMERRSQIRRRRAIWARTAVYERDILEVEKALNLQLAGRLNGQIDYGVALT